MLEIINKRIETIIVSSEIKEIQNIVPALPGPKGDPGDDGHTPIKGVDYFDGLKGDPGNNGNTPIKGVDYFDGEKGDPGINGTTPVKGVDYFDGVPGVNGADSMVPGPPGLKGEDSIVPGPPGEAGHTPIKGVDYFDGLKGDPGNDAIVYSVVAEIDFGNRSSYEKTVVTGLAWVTPTTRIIPVLYGEDIGHRSAEDGVIEGIVLSISNIVNGIGFTIHAYAPQTTNGIYKIMCIGG